MEKIGKDVTKETFERERRRKLLEAATAYFPKGRDILNNTVDTIEFENASDSLIQKYVKAAMALDYNFPLFYTFQNLDDITHKLTYDFLTSHVHFTHIDINIYNFNTLFMEMTTYFQQFLLDIEDANWPSSRYTRSSMAHKCFDIVQATLCPPNGTFKPSDINNIDVNQVNYLGRHALQYMCKL